MALPEIEKVSIAIGAKDFPLSQNGRRSGFELESAVKTAIAKGASFNHSSRYPRVNPTDVLL